MSFFQKAILGFGLVAFGVAYYCTFFKKPAPRQDLYLDQKEVINFFAKEKAANSNGQNPAKPGTTASKPPSPNPPSTEKGETLNEAIDKRLAYYSKLRDDLTLNRYLVAVVAGLAVLLIVSKKESMKIPWVEQEVPRTVALRVLPLLSLFLWLDFGYLLNACLDSRIVAMRLINSSLERGGYEQKNAIKFQKAQYTITRSSELEDHGLLDSWFWNFLQSNDTFVIAGRGWYNWIIPVIGLLWYAALYGLLHAVAFYLPTEDTTTKSFAPTLYAVLISFIAAVVVGFSHFSFYYAGRHDNWFQFATLGFSLLFYAAFVVNSARRPN